MATFTTQRPGSRGPDTELLQLGLGRAGFYPFRPDGIFGPNTQNAVTAFQKANGLTVDGIAGSKTWAALRPWLVGFTRHKVRPGDSLYKIAMSHGTTLRALRAANPDADPANLQIGSAVTVPFGFELVPDDISFTSTVMELCAEGLAARYPFISSGTPGKSVLGQPLISLKIGIGPRQVFYNGSHHANEWLTSVLLMRFLEDYGNALVSGGSIRGCEAEKLYMSTTLCLVPMVNPDGVDLVTGLISSGEAYERARRLAESYPNIPFPSGWKANIEGIDLNLQYPAGWEKARDIKFDQGFTKPGPRDYVGAKPLQAPESRAVYDYTLDHDFSLSISYHTQGGVIYWRYLDMEPDGAQALAEDFARLSGYTVENAPEQSAYAGYKDWFILKYDRPGYTVEAGRGVNPLPLSRFEEIYRDNLGILVRGLVDLGHNDRARR